MKIQKTPQERATIYLKKSNEDLAKLNLAVRLVVHFPKRNKVPLLSRIAMWILQKQGGILDIEFHSKDKK